MGPGPAEQRGLCLDGTFLFVHQHEAPGAILVPPRILVSPPEGVAEPNSPIKKDRPTSVDGRFAIGCCQIVIRDARRGGSCFIASLDDSTNNCVLISELPLGG